MKLHICAILLISLPVTIPSAIASQPSGTLQSMKLLAFEVGWAATQNQLFWTTDGGTQWRDITPKTALPAEVASVFFLDTSTGWVLLSGNDEAQGPSRFDFASTTDAGTTWSVTHFNPPVNSRQYILSGDGRVDFVDSLHGWVNLGVVSSASAHLGILLATQNGGRTWDWAPGGSGAGRGAILFVNTGDGWAVSPEGDELYFTHNGAKSWHELSLDAPPLMHSTAQPTYDLPVFEDSRRGFLPVAFSGPDDPAVEMVLFGSNDGGKTWRLRGRMPRSSSPWATTVADSVWIAATISNQALAFTAITLDNKTATGRTTTHVNADIGHVGHVDSISQLSFLNGTRGWLTADSHSCANLSMNCPALLSTNDGGISWSNITPPNANELPAKTPSPGFRVSSGSHLSSKMVSNGAPRSSRPSDPNKVVYEAFDISRVIPITPKNDMQTWWTYSPYWDTSVYLPKSPNRGTDKNLTPAWVDEVRKEGWSLIPTWFGLQAPCACNSNLGPSCTHFKHTFSSTPKTAKKEGIAEAKAASHQADLLGIGGIVIYHDIENYAPSTKCSRAVIAFLDGWVNELPKTGVLYTGVYGNPIPAKKDFSRVSPLPDDVWIATGNKLQTIWGLDPLCDPFSKPPCPLWSLSQRINQNFLAPRSSKGESWGKTVKYVVDHDVEDADVVIPSVGNQIAQNGNSGTPGSSCTKDCNFDYTSIDYPNAELTNALGINNLGDIVGYYDYVANSRLGFLYSKGQFTTIEYPNAAQTEAWGINDAGQIVGWYIDSNSNFNGFRVSPPYSDQDYSSISLGNNTFTVAFGINDDNQIVGYYQDPNGYHGFLDNTNNNVFTTIDDGGGTLVRNINGDSLIVGLVQGGNSFLYDAVTGNFTTFGPTVYGVNDSLEMVGGNILYDYESGAQTPVSYPGATGTGAFAINDYANIVGNWYDSNNVQHGFLATPKQH
jgi:photosystem II stability/assembly factor-like uncharacterized protein